MTQKPSSLSAAAHHYINWCRQDMLPLWRVRGVDKKYGGFYEQLHFDGSPDTGAMRRVRVAARQIYAFAHASMLGWGDSAGLVEWGVDYLASSVMRADGEPGFPHMLDERGRIIDTRRDLYDHAFHILAFSWACRATGDAQMLSLAKETLAFVEESMQAPNGGWYEGDPAGLPRRQNPHMHMLEALLALYEASQDRAFLRRADEVITLCAERFFDPEVGLLLEDFTDDLTPVRPARVEPGHMAEWCWLLHIRARLDEQTPINLAAKMGHGADGFGDRAAGFLCDAYDTNGTLLAPTRRLWGQTEWLKSLLVRIDEKDAGNAPRAAALIERLFESYFAVDVPGLWMDQFDAAGAPMAKRVPASIVYHLISAGAQVNQTRKDVET